MRRIVLISILFFLTFSSQGKSNFSLAYSSYSNIPSGLLEAVAWTNTRMNHRTSSIEACSGIPQPFGIMGLYEDGKNYFKTNALTIAQFSGIDIEAQKTAAKNQIMAYAAYYSHLATVNNVVTNDYYGIRNLLHQISEIPDTGYVNLLAKDMQVFEIFRFMSDKSKAETYGFMHHTIDFSALFGTSNYEVLSSPKVKFTDSGIRSEKGDLYVVSADKSTEYGPAIWDPAPPCNYSSRNGVAISAITIHTIQGTYAGAISWAQNCASSVSYHYVIRSSDGQVTQMLLEEEKGWHVGSENPYTIGYEHEGFVDDPIWYTEEMYASSADLSRDIVNSGYSIPPLRTYYKESSASTNTLGGCTKIKGHQHYPNQTHTDPGINWDWEKYYQLINNTYVPNLITTDIGNLTDSGGAAGDYQDDERHFWLIQPQNAINITLDFTSFTLEDWYDNLFIYDGDSINDPLIGSYTYTNNPGTIISSGGSLLIEFRSDCGTVDAGWEANFTSLINNINEIDGVQVVVYPNPTSNILTVQNTKEDDQLYIYDLVGKLIWSGKDNNIDVSNLETGAYTICIVRNHSVIKKSFIKY